MWIIVIHFFDSAGREGSRAPVLLSNELPVPCLPGGVLGLPGVFLVLALAASHQLMAAFCLHTNSAPSPPPGKLQSSAQARGNDRDRLASRTHISCRCDDTGSSLGCRDRKASNTAPSGRVRIFPSYLHNPCVC